jgi:hypothetical protein
MDRKLGVVTVCLLAAGAARQSRGGDPYALLRLYQFTVRTRSVLNYRVRKVAALGKRSLHAVKTCKCAGAKKKCVRPAGVAGTDATADFLTDNNWGLLVVLVGGICRKL